MPSPNVFSAIGAVTGTTTGTVKTIGGRAIHVTAANRNAAIRYLQFFDSTSSTAGAPKLEILLKPSDEAEKFISQNGLTDGVQFSTGITYGFSTTSGSYVAGTAADHTLTLWYF